MIRALARLAAALLLAATLPALAADYAPIAGGPLNSALSEDGKAVTVAPYRLRTTPVTNAEYLAFVLQHPEWRRGAVAALFAAGGYLAGWSTPGDFAPLQANAPVTQVSWHAARAFCQSEQARLPSWYEWEMVAAADATRRDARSDPLWRERILQWYEHPASQSLPLVGQNPNVWHVSDLHGSIYEWVEDFNGLFVATDSRSQGEQRTLGTCGAGALSLNDRENYAILMRIAMLAALNANDTLGSVGFRCARDGLEASP